MELDPPYCDVIVERWERFTGQTASRDAADISADPAVLTNTAVQATR